MRHEHAHQAATPATSMDIPQDALALIAQSTAEQHRAILALQDLFASRGAIISQHQLTLEHPEVTIKELEECRSFAVINLSNIVLQVGWGGRLASGGGATPVTSLSFLQIPTDCNNCEISGTGLTATPAVFLFVRYRHIAHLAGGSLDGGREVVGAVTPESPRKVALGAGVSTAVLPANLERRGILITNTSAAKISLGLGQAAVEGDDIVLEPGGSWGGTISGVLWQGAINGFSAAGGSVTVVEI